MTYAYEKYRFNLPDNHYNLRHYDFGEEIYMFDDDGSGLLYGIKSKMGSILVEEAKHANFNTLDLRSPGISDLSERARLRNKTLYCFVNIYCYFKANGTLLNAKEDRDGLALLAHAEHLIIGVNQKTVQLLGGKQIQWMTEKEWAQLNYKMRNATPPANLPLYDQLIYKIIQPSQILNQGFIYED